MVTRGNLDDRLATVEVRLTDHAAFDDERWNAHFNVHEAVADSLRDYKKDANEWRATLSDLRGTFIPKAEFQSEHRAQYAALHGEIEKLAGIVSALDTRLDVVTSDLKDVHTEQQARRSVFTDSRNIIATLGLLFGIIASALLVLDRLTP